MTLILKWEVSILFRPEVFLNNYVVKSWGCWSSSIATSCLWPSIIILWGITVTSIYTAKGSSFIYKWIPCARSHILMLLQVRMFIIPHPVIVLHILKSHVLSSYRESLTALILLRPYRFVLPLEEATCDSWWASNYDPASCLWSCFFIFESVALFIKLCKLSSVTPANLISVLISFKLLLL
jgi:hypothetical protein